MTDENTTKPCPFCGGRCVDAVQVDIEDSEGIPMCATCADCGASGPFKYFLPEVAELASRDDIAQATGWNGRVEET